MIPLSLKEWSFPFTHGILLQLLQSRTAAREAGPESHLVHPPSLATVYPRVLSCTKSKVLVQFQVKVIKDLFKLVTKHLSEVKMTSAESACRIYSAFKIQLAAQPWWTAPGYVDLVKSLRSQITCGVISPYSLFCCPQQSCLFPAYHNTNGNKSPGVKQPKLDYSHTVQKIEYCW